MIRATWFALMQLFPLVCFTAIPTARKAPSATEILLWDGRFRNEAATVLEGPIHPGGQEEFFEKIEKSVGRKVMVWQSMELDLEGPAASLSDSENSRRSNRVAVCTSVKEGLGVDSFLAILKKNGHISVTHFKEPYYQHLRILKVIDLRPGEGKQIILRDMDGGSSGESGHLSIQEFRNERFQQFGAGAFYHWARYTSETLVVRLVWDGQVLESQYFGLFGPGAWVLLGASLPKGFAGSSLGLLKARVAKLNPRPLVHDPGVVNYLKKVYYENTAEKLFSPPSALAMLIATGMRPLPEDNILLEDLLDTEDARRGKADHFIEAGMIMWQGASWQGAIQMGKAIQAAPEYDKAWAGLGLCMAQAGNIPLVRFCHRQLRILKSDLANKLQKSCKVKLD